MSDPVFKPTPAQTAAMDAMRQERDRALERAKVLTAKIEAWDTLCGPLPAIHATGNGDGWQDTNINLMGALEAYVNGSPKPVSYSEAKGYLRSHGIAENQVDGPYFYTAVARLKDKDRIAVSSDKMLSRARHQ